MTKEIPLTQGKVAIVDDCDYEYFSQWKWYALRDARNWYAIRNGPRTNGKRTQIRIHRVLMEAPPWLGVDHIDGDGLNNQRSNLRLATHQENIFNMRMRIDGTSAFKGVSWKKERQKWCASIRFGRKCMHIGYFSDEQMAATAYDNKAYELFGEFARLNFPREVRNET